MSSLPSRGERDIARGSTAACRRPIAVLSASLIAFLAVAAPSRAADVMPAFSRLAAADSEGLVLAALLAYQDGQTRKDMRRLERSWRMTTTDRELTLAGWRSCASLETNLAVDEIRVDSDVAIADFSQRVDARCGGQGQTRMQRLRALLEREGQGWRIAALAGLGPARVVPVLGGSGPDGTLLETLSRYGAALGSCDLEALSQEWLMTRTDRSMVESMCRADEPTRVSIQDQVVAIDGDRGRVDFEQVIHRGASAAPTRTSLRASLVRRDDGAWTIYRMRQRPD